MTRPLRSTANFPVTYGTAAAQTLKLSSARQRECEQQRLMMRYLNIYHSGCPLPITFNAPPPESILHRTILRYFCYHRHSLVIEGARLIPSYAGNCPSKPRILSAYLILRYADMLSHVSSLNSISQACRYGDCTARILSASSPGIPIYDPAPVHPLPQPTSWLAKSKRAFPRNFSHSRVLSVPGSFFEVGGT